MSETLTALQELQQEVSNLIQSVDFRKSELDAAVLETSQSAEQALLSEQNALTSEQNALLSEQNALTSEQNALVSEQNAAQSAQFAQEAVSGLTFGNLTEFTSDILTISGGTNAVLGSGTTIQVKQASASQNGFISSTDWNIFNSKESAITSGTTAQYYRGDKTFQDFDTSVRASLLTGFVEGINTGLTATDTVLDAFGKVQAQLNNKQNTLTNPITGTGTSGQVSFFNGTTTQTGDNGLFWDNTNKRLGIGLANPSQELTVKGTIRSEALTGSDNIFFQGVNSAGTIVGQMQEASSIGSGGLLFNGERLNNTGGNGVFFSGFVGTTASGNNAAIEFRGNGGTIASIADLPSGIPIAIFSKRSGAATVNQMALFQTGNLLLQNGGTFTDAGFRLDVNGTARVQGDLTMTGNITFPVHNTYSIGSFNQRAAGIYCENIYTGSSSANRFAVRGFSTSIGLTIGLNTYTQANSSAVLELIATTRGFLPPRLTTTERNAIATPATGLEVYNSTNNSKDIYNGSAWVNVVSSSNFDGLDIAFGTSTGTKIGTATNQLLSFWNATPIVQPANTVAINDVLVNVGLRASGGISNFTSDIYIGSSSISSSAILQADSTTKGFLPPRMTASERAAISSPATGLIVYQTDGAEGLYQKLAGGWVNLEDNSIIQALGSISGTVTINLALGTLITATLTGATTLAFSGLPPSGRETAFTLRFAGIHAITLPVGTKYPAGAVPVPAGALYEIPCTINNAGELIVYGVINDIKTP